LGTFLQNDIFSLRMYGLVKRCLPAFVGTPADVAIFLALAGAVSASLISIAVSQILLAAAIIGYIWKTKRSELELLLHNPIIPPLLAFILWTIVASLFSPNSVQNLGVLKKAFIYLLLLLVPAIAHRQNSVTWIYRMVFVFSCVACTKGLIQYIANPHRDLLNRIKGFHSHWMTYSGMLMLVFVMLLAYALCIGWRNKHRWVIPLAVLIVAILILTETRNAWIGTIAAACILIFLRRPRATAGLLVIILAVYLLMPAKIKQRLHTGWDVNDPNTSNRIELFMTSIRLIKDNPWFGVGPVNVNREALRYRGTDQYPDWMYQHMHNNFFQIAAERGVPGLLFWMWFMLRLAWDAMKVYRARPGGSFLISSESIMVSAAALGAWVAFFLAGTLEYNFGDSEPLTLFLFIMSAPYVFRQFATSPNSRTGS
jgi:O-antigen ligase